MLASRIVDHLRNKTLMTAAKRKVRYLSRRLPGDGDTYYGDEATLYELQRTNTSEWYAQQRVGEQLISSFPIGSSVLDVPFGTGRFAESYNARQMSVSGLDASDEMLAMAHRLRGDAVKSYDLRVGDARQLPWESNSFDLVVCFRFLNHIVSFGDAKKVLSEFARVTRKTVILDIAFRENQADSRRKPPSDREQAGLRLTLSDVEAMATEAKLEIRTIIEQYKESDAAFYAIVCEKSQSADPII